jgi:hypothetical protein
LKKPARYVDKISSFDASWYDEMLQKFAMKSCLAGLYYPFSRCVHPASLKQMLLVFDEITFVDPVDDAQWRAKLFEELELHDSEFARYQGIDGAQCRCLSYSTPR